MNLKSLAVAVALVGSTVGAAQAATTPISLGTTTIGNVNPLNYQLTGAPHYGSFLDEFTFSVGAGGGGASGDVAKIFASYGGVTIANILGFSFDLYNTGTHTVVSTGTGSGDTLSIAPTSLTAGNYEFRVGGNGIGMFGGSYGGTVTVTAVPEPESYALFLAGLGLMGFIARRRTSV